MDTNNKNLTGTLAKDQAEGDNSTKNRTRVLKNPTGTNAKDHTQNNSKTLTGVHARDCNEEDKEWANEKVKKDVRAGPGKMVKGKGKSKGHDTKGNDGSRYYLLVDPRPGEAPNYDNSTVVQGTGTGRSPVHNLDVIDNALHSQHLKDEGAGRGAGMYKGVGGGRSVKKKEEDARRGGDMYKVRGAGLDGTMKGRTAGGATRSNTEDRGVGLDGTVKDRTAGGATRSNTEDRGAGLDGTVKGRTAGGATRSNTGKVENDSGIDYKAETSSNGGDSKAKSSGDSKAGTSGDSSGDAKAITSCDESKVETSHCYLKLTILIFSSYFLSFKYL